MPSHVTEVVVVTVALAATAAAVFLASPTKSSTASVTPGPRPARATPTRVDEKPGPPEGPATRATAASVGMPAEEEDEFRVNESAFMEPTGPGLVRIGSFNMLHVGKRSDKDYRRLARIVRQFDLCGVLELENEQALVDLSAALGPDFHYVTSDREAGDPSRPGTFEFYGFVYRGTKVTPLDGTRGFFPDEQGVFSREPFFASFRAGTFDFTMTLLHAESPGNSANLTRELEHLPDVFRYVRELDPNESDVLLAGDFNRSPSASSGGPAAAWRPFLAIPGMDCVIPDTRLTSLSSNATGFANHYDDICLVHDATRELASARGAFDFVAAMFEKQNAPAKRLVSDHLPVFAEFRTDLDDDDGVAVPTTAGSAEAPVRHCCKICRTSKPCGDACIPARSTCKRPPGCACGS